MPDERTTEQVIADAIEHAWVDAHTTTGPWDVFAADRVLAALADAGYTLTKEAP